jgi:hypothetical protein
MATNSGHRTRKYLKPRRLWRGEIGIDDVGTIILPIIIVTNDAFDISRALQEV